MTLFRSSLLGAPSLLVLSASLLLGACGEDGGGVPGATCGGRAGGCGPSLFCDFGAAFDCGFADGMGTCAARPTECSLIFAPVCGCDGMTYSNACGANAGGTDVQSDGECASTPPPSPAP